jgi:hypothetical protein
VAACLAPVSRACKPQWSGVEGSNTVLGCHLRILLCSAAGVGALSGCISQGFEPAAEMVHNIPLSSILVDLNQRPPYSEIP